VKVIFVVLSSANSNVRFLADRNVRLISVGWRKTGLR
jgi:hypothetical protein